MPEFVQHRAHPIFVRHDVRQHAHIPLAVDVGAEGMRALALFLVEIAAGDHVVDRQAHPLVEVLAQLEDVGLGERSVEVGVKHRRRFLEERVVVMPRHEVAFRHAAVLGEDRIELGLGLHERLAGEFVEFVEQLDQLVAVLLVQIQLQRVKVLEPQGDRRLVAQLHQLGQVLLDVGADALARFPNGLPALGVG